MIRSTHEGIQSAILWMSFLGLVLSWLPVIGPFVAGVIGGRKAGTVKQALIAVVLPALLIGAVVFVLGTVINIPFISGLLAGIVFLIILKYKILLIVGAVVGATILMPAR